MIRSWVAIAVLFVGMPVLVGAEELPAPKVVPPPPLANPPVSDVPAPKATVPDLPLPDLGVPSKPTETKPVEGPALTDPLPATGSPKVVAPSALLPAPNPQPAPSIVVPTNPNPSGPGLQGTTPALPNENSVAPANTPNNNVPAELKWRYKWHNGQWWYWSPDERWMIWDRNSWTIYDPATYQAPAGFAKPGPRVVTQRALSVPLPESYSGAEVSVPQSYYIQPTPYAFGADSYYGPNGPAASYYNRRTGMSITLGTPAYVPVYPSYPTPIYGYPGYGVPGYYGGRGVTIGFGF